MSFLSVLHLTESYEPAGRQGRAAIVRALAAVPGVLGVETHGLQEHADPTHHRHRRRPSRLRQITRR